ncbi:hypothetical protein RW1_030_00450 [Rhodococcus wratislaviensis NBRC 100605]|uniref:Uncharacterized protein n=1 Tax=Rhodococcus wratislaviensis NBRC 100605 TaxID=1219028 RepID=X0PTA5_RHOWR|nr:hypothetical protein RW1_030_00450 [Rhodococcus wratislaviensis NBRC 100605]
MQAAAAKTGRGGCAARGRVEIETTQQGWEWVSRWGIRSPVRRITELSRHDVEKVSKPQNSTIFTRVSQ